MAYYGIVIDNQADPYLISDTLNEQFDELVRMNRDDGHIVTVVEQDRHCIICTDVVEGWSDVSENPMHGGPCYAEYEAWRRADLMLDWP